ncbi:hypothetical protein GZH47_02615 [Paenibacillus rhizovicinus]|uniref:Uncharacterized protein n=1 Tax=Paenibacillus rhizovicinus TaxID=2704463 RepID=A0A6C0NUH4_9BACL|nr:hypothetical protein [Paenibacillus rhizovicinus]QHW29835.1 hypothetical protein GZH47_02615 [Paenibacillus rhizovicinus]
MNGVKPYAIFALLLPCILALDLVMDFLQRLPADQIMRNFLFPFKMLDSVEKTIFAILLFFFVRKPLVAMLRRLWPNTGSSEPSGGSGGTPSAPQQTDNQQQ